MYFRIEVRRAISMCIDYLVVQVWATDSEKFDRKRWAARKLRRIEREALVRTF